MGVGSMAAILGLDLATIELACREAAEGELVAPANVNSQEQVVIAGHAAAVDRAILLCKAKGARRTVKLPVSAPFHCALMQGAQDRLEADLRAVAFRDPELAFVNNADARLVRSAAECRDGLVRQVSSPVLWQGCVERMAQAGVTTFVEVGPGMVLSGLVRKIVKGARTLSVDSPESLAAALATLAGGAER